MAEQSLTCFQQIRPIVMLLVLISGLRAPVLEGSMLGAPVRLLSAAFGPVYLVAATALGGVLIRKAWVARREKSVELMWDVFKISIFYLFSIFLALIIERLV